MTPPAASDNSPSFDLTGRVAVVTGASRGLGRSFAVTLAGAGARVVITARKADDLDETAREVEAAGTEAAKLALDVRDEASIRAFGEAAVKAFGRVDVLVNNAGCNVRKPSLELSWDDWNLVMDTNLRGAFFVTQALAPALFDSPAARIVFIGSLTSIMGFPGLPVYSASRGGAKQLTASLASEWAERGVTVNCLAPGFLKTAQTAALYADPTWVAELEARVPQGRPGQPRDLAGTLLFLASDASAYMTGQTLVVDGGMSTGSMRVHPKPTS